MPLVDVTGEEYGSYTTLDNADLYLAADAARAVVWATRTENEKGRGLVSATRTLQRLSWAAGSPPAIDVAPVAVQDATAMLAADILTSPELAGGASAGASNVKRAKAGSAEVEFFRPVAGTILPLDILSLLGVLLGNSGGTSVSLFGIVGGNDFGSRFDDTDYTIVDPYR